MSAVRQVEYFPMEYFSGCNASISFNNKKLDEIVTIEFGVQEQVEPIFGYASYTYDKLLVGSRFVVGTFAIYYTKDNYLQDVLQELQTTETTPALSPSELLSVNPSSFEDYAEQSKMYYWGNSKKELPRSKKPYFDQPDKGITIRIRFDQSLSRSREQKIIQNVKFFNPRMVIDNVGTPTVEQYQFMGKDYF